MLSKNISVPFKALFRLSRSCRVLEMFAGTHTDGFQAIIRKKLHCSCAKSGVIATTFWELWQRAIVQTATILWGGCFYFINDYLTQQTLSWLSYEKLTWFLKFSHFLCMFFSSIFLRTWQLGWWLFKNKLILFCPSDRY